MTTISKEKIIALPGIQPRTFVNESAADELQKVVEGLRSGNYVGVGYVAIDSDGRSVGDWNIPNKMGHYLFISWDSTSLP